MVYHYLPTPSLLQSPGVNHNSFLKLLFHFTLDVTFKPLPPPPFVTPVSKSFSFLLQKPLTESTSRPNIPQTQDLKSSNKQGVEVTHKNPVEDGRIETGTTTTSRTLGSYWDLLYREEIPRRTTRVLKNYGIDYSVTSGDTKVLPFDLFFVKKKETFPIGNPRLPFNRSFFGLSEETFLFQISS